MQTKSLGRIISKGAGLSDRQIRVIASTATPDRSGDVMVVSGADLSSYKRNPVVLWNHDTSKPIGTAQIEQKNGRLEALVSFAPAGASEKADEICALCKSGVISAASIGFIGKASEPIKGGGRKYTSFEIVELSIVSAPCNPEATVIERSLSSRRSVFGRTVSAKSTERDRRRRTATALGLKHGPETMTAADRRADLARLKAKGVTPVADLAGPAFAHAKAAELHDDAMARSAAAYSSAPASEAQRLGDLARLR